MPNNKNQKHKLSGGRQTGIYKSGKTVIRPRTPFSENIHQFLRDIRKAGFTKCPVPHGFDENGNEVLEYIEGDVSNYPLSREFSSLEIVYSAGRVLNQFHAASETVFKSINKNLQWLLPNRSQPQLICHGDYAPYNVVVKNAEVIGMIDFDTIHFGTKPDDIAYGMYRWATLFRQSSPDRIGPLEMQIKRAKVFCDGYGLSAESRAGLVDVMIKKIEALVLFMRENAKAGNQAFVQNIRDGHDTGYEGDVEYLKGNREFVLRGIGA